jgi:hypothetical protein
LPTRGEEDAGRRSRLILVNKMSDEPTVSNPLGTVIRLLTFRLTREEFFQLDHRHLALGVALTWVVGIGRWWDDPRANVLQHSGVGSVVYILLLSLMLWLVIWPLRPQRWSYRHVLTFVSLTSPPALLYAIPVERFTSLETARTLNVWFLATVAAWRVALLFFYLRRHAGLPVFSIVVAALLPMTFIVVTLTVLNLERAVFDVMGGLRGGGTANDRAYGVLVALTLISMLLFVPLLLSYIFLWVRASARK